MADELIDADTMARLSMMMRRAPVGHTFGNPGTQRTPSPNPYNTEFPDHIGRPPMPAVYNERFSDLVGAPGEAKWPPLPPRSTRDPYDTDYDNSRIPEAVEAELLGRFLPPHERAAHRTFGSSFNPGGSVPLPVEPDVRAPGHTRSVFSGPGTAPDPGRAARVEQLMRELEEQQALEARLRALGR